MTPTCATCGRFLRGSRPVVVITGEGYSRGPGVSHVVGDCSRCGPQVRASSGYWQSWDFWDWGDEPCLA